MCHAVCSRVSERVRVMKKFLTIILTIMMLFAALPVSAAENGRTLRLKNTNAQGPVFVAVYSGNRLTAVAAAEAEMDGKDALVTADGLEAFRTGYTLKVYIPQLNVLVEPAAEEPEASPSPAPEETQAPTQEPEETLHPAYESEAAAMLAFMVVKDVTTGLEEDMPVTVVTAYYQGREVQFTAEDGAILDSVPDAYSDLGDMEIASLQEGDVIYCRASLSGQLVGVDLLFRPMENDIVAEEPDYPFTELYTIGGKVAGRWSVVNFGGDTANENQYAFGVVEDRSGNILILTDQAGRALDALYLGMLDDTVVYVYDKTARDKLSIGAVGDIFPSDIPADTRDEEDNIIRWDPEDDHHYAFVRLYKGIVTDIVLYTNY